MQTSTANQTGGCQSATCFVSAVARIVSRLAVTLTRLPRRMDQQRDDAADDQEVEYHSTVTDFARLRGWSTSVPLTTAT